MLVAHAEAVEHFADLATGDRGVVDEEHIELGTRIRDVDQAPDGSIIVLTDDGDGKVLRLRPQP